MTQNSCLIKFTLYFLSLISLYQCGPLRGITIRNWPYANRLENGQFEGFVVDILNEISRMAKIPYTLELSNQTEYGGWSKNGTVTGMIGQVYRNEVDFAIGDITRLTTRDRYVDFSHPFLKFGLSALISKDNIGNITSFKELSEQSEIAYGVKKVGANLPLFHDSPVITKMYNYMDANPSTFVRGEKEGIKRVKTSKYAFITESPFNEYVMNRDCDLTVIDDKQKHFQFEYAIAMRKGLSQQTRHEISDALREMKKNRVLDELKDKYWKTDKCVEDSNVVEIDPKRSAQLSREPRDKDDHHKKKKDKLRKKNSSLINSFSQLILFSTIVLNFLLNH